MKFIKLLIFAIAFNSCYAEQNNQRNTSQAEKSYFEQISSFTLPDKLELCGERLPLEIPEVRERAEREFYMLLQQPGQIILYLKRSGRYFPMYEKLIKENGLPDDVKYLSVAESALYQSRSSKGAEGLWQFMEGTARSYNMRVDKDVDERRHPEKSTRAALTYLKRSFASYKSWAATFASYNMGQSGVSNAMAFQDSDSYYDLFLNEETSRFVFRIAIIKEIMSNSEKYGFKIPKWERYSPDNVRSVKVDGAIANLAEWAKANGTSYKDVKLLNPWILGRSLPAPKGDAWIIAVPGL